MKLKYKKIILLTTMSTMGIGLLTLSINHDKTEAKESEKLLASVESVTSEDTAVEDFGSSKNITPTVTLAPTITPIPTPSPEPTPLPVYDIEQEGTYPKIDKLIQDYYAAKNNRDVEAMKALLSDSSGTYQEELQAKTEYIDKYLNIEIYTKKGYLEGTYIVYVYSEIKFTSINTPAPGLAKFYIVTGANGDLKIFSGEMDEVTQAYYAERNNDSDIIKLIEKTDKKCDEAKKSDEDLNNFWKNINEIVNNNSGDSAAEGDSN